MAKQAPQLKLTPDTQAKIIQAIKLGSTKTLAASYAGISRRTFYNWMEKGEEQKTGIYRDFLDALDQAEGERVARWLAIINKAAQNDNWTSAAWLLERTRPDDYSLKNRVDVNLTGEQTITLGWGDSEDNSS